MRVIVLWLNLPSPRFGHIFFVALIAPQKLFYAKKTTGTWPAVLFVEFNIAINVSIKALQKPIKPHGYRQDRHTNHVRCCPYQYKSTPDQTC